MSAGIRKATIENILKEAEPDIDKTPKDKKPASVGKIIGNDNVVINGRRPTRKASPPRKANSLLRMCFVALCAFLPFCMEQIKPL